MTQVEHRDIPERMAHHRPERSTLQSRTVTFNSFSVISNRLVLLSDSMANIISQVLSINQCVLLAGYYVTFVTKESTTVKYFCFKLVFEVRQRLKNLSYAIPKTSRVSK